MARAQRRTRRADRIIVGTAITLLVTPVVVDLVASGRKRVHAYLAADAFYYLQVSRNIASHGSVSFDGEHATNGFHPLWQAILAVEHALASSFGGGHTPMLSVAVLTGLALLVGTVLLLARVSVVAYGRVSPLFVLLPVGVYALLYAPVWIWTGGLRESGINPFEGPMPIYGTLWSYANGMETALVLATFACVLLVVTVRSLDHRQAGAWLGGSLTLMVLARLDTGLIAVSILGAFGLAAWARRDRSLARTVAVSASVLAAVLLVYVVVNRAYAGAWLPVSGTLKSTFPAGSLGNWRDLRQLFEHPEFFGSLRSYRLFPEIVPSVLALVYLCCGRFGLVVRSTALVARDRYRIALAGTAVGVVLLGAYNFFYVPNFNQGHWYYPVNTLFVTLAVLDWVADVDLSRVAVAVAVAGAVVSIAMFATLGRRADYHRRFADFWFDGAPSLRAAYGGDVPPIIEADDGIDVVALRTQGISSIGLMLDHAALAQYEDDRLLDVALARGIDHIGSLNYFDASGLTRRSTSDEIRPRIEALLARPGAAPPDLSDFEFSVEKSIRPEKLSTPWRDTDGRYVIIRFQRR